MTELLSPPKASEPQVRTDPSNAAKAPFLYSVMRPGEEGAIGVLFRTATGLSESLATAVIAIEPSDSAEPSGTVKLQLPSESVVVVPRELPSAKIHGVPATAVPVKVGVLSLVRLSSLETPVSEVELRSVEGAGVAVSTVRLRVDDGSDIGI